MTNYFLTLYAFTSMDILLVKIPLVKNTNRTTKEGLVMNKYLLSERDGNCIGKATF